jgi:hypothetical protein
VDGKEASKVSAPATKYVNNTKHESINQSRERVMFPTNILLVALARSTGMYFDNIG